VAFGKIQGFDKEESQDVSACFICANLKLWLKSYEAQYKDDIDQKVDLLNLMASRVKSKICSTN